MAFKRSWDQEVTVAANANKQQFAFTPPDTWQDIQITSIYSPTTTARWEFGLVVNGQEKCLVPAARFAAGNEPVRVDVSFPRGASCYLEIQDLTGTGASNIHFTVFYEVARDAQVN